MHVERLSNVPWQAALHQIGQDRLQIFKLYIDVWQYTERCLVNTTRNLNKPRRNTPSMKYRNKIVFQ